MPASIPPISERQWVSGADLEQAMEEGQIAFAQWFSWFMRVNGFSHSQLVALCKLCTGGKAWLHSSTIAGWMNARTANPGPKSFVSIEYVCRDIEAAQQGEFITNFGGLTGLIQDAVIMRDEQGQSVTAAYLIEVFLGLRPVPIDLKKLQLSVSDAEAFSVRAGRLVRKLMSIHNLDPIEDAAVIGNRFQGNPVQKAKLTALIKGNAAWTPDEVEDQVSKLTKLLVESFSYTRTPAELIQELSQ